MRRIIKYIISFIFILIVTCSGLLCSASIIEKTLSDDQMQIILSNSNTTGFAQTFSNSNAFGNAVYIDYNTGVQYVVRGNRAGYERPASQSNVSINLSMYLSGYDSITVQFVVAFNSLFNSAILSRVQAVNGSIATDLQYTVVGNLALKNVSIPPATITSTGNKSYSGFIYQSTISTDEIDYLRLTFNSFPSSMNYFLVGFVGVYVNGTSEALQNIDTQVSQIGSKVDDLTTAIQNAASNIGAIVSGQGNLLTAVEDIKDYAESIDDKQDIIIYATQNDQLIIQEYSERLTDIKNEFYEYNSILEQYYNAPDVNNVTNIIDGGMPSEYDPTVVAPVLSAIFNNSIVTIILVAVLALAVMSYVLFGKKG